MWVLEASCQHSWCNYRAMLRICFSLTRLLKRVLQNCYVPNSWLFLLEPELNYGVFQDELLKGDAGKRVLCSAMLGISYTTRFCLCWTGNSCFEEHILHSRGRGKAASLLRRNMPVQQHWCYWNQLLSTHQEPYGWIFFLFVKGKNRKSQYKISTFVSELTL